MNGEARACWIVCLPDGKRFPMVGEKTTKADALAYVRNIWPDAEIEA